ncbi:hypothetical protein B0H16DRAFT_1472689 [Mycena metata]|uniref:Uncharacterized protein n=1 Tax=Mycena metata TaxID=1033252 RepID=A0AAD7HMD1_9AGAR|nr:hypothetical protein B0H16DRAFT_1472689 [Mycena metata]
MPPKGSSNLRNEGNIGRATDFRFNEDRTQVQCRACNDHLALERRSWILVKNGAGHLTTPPHLKAVQLAKERERGRERERETAAAINVREMQFVAPRFSGPVAAASSADLRLVANAGLMGVDEQRKGYGRSRKVRVEEGRCWRVADTHTNGENTSSALIDWNDRAESCPKIIPRSGNHVAAESQKCTADVAESDWTSFSKCAINGGHGIVNEHRRTNGCITANIAELVLPSVIFWQASSKAASRMIFQHRDVPETHMPPQKTLSAREYYLISLSRKFYNKGFFISRKKKTFESHTLLVERAAWSRLPAVQYQGMLYQPLLHLPSPADLNGSLKYLQLPPIRTAHAIKPKTSRVCFDLTKDSFWWCLKINTLSQKEYTVDRLVNQSTLAERSQSKAGGKAESGTSANRGNNQTKSAQLGDLPLADWALLAPIWRDKISPAISESLTENFRRKQDSKRLQKHQKLPATKLSILNPMSLTCFGILHQVELVAAHGPFDNDNDIRSFQWFSTKSGGLKWRGDFPSAKPALRGPSRLRLMRVDE